MPHFTLKFLAQAALLVLLARSDSGGVGGVAVPSAGAGTQGLFDWTRVREEIASYSSVAQKIMDFTLNGTGKHQAYDRLAKFTDTYGNRIAGSQNLEDAIDYMLDTMKKDKLDNVHGEKAMVPHWVRGNESATMLEPRLYNLAMMGLGGSIGTPKEGIKAEALVVRSFDELHSKADQAKGKIIVYNQGYVSYPVSVAYRDYGADEAAKLGGLASLIRSITPFSIHSPHTGWQDYTNVTKVPTACITVEDAEMLDRMDARGTKIVIHLKMNAQNLPQAESRNTIAEITGSKYPDEVVLVSGHLDTWDVGQGAMDDGGGAFISWQALSIIRQLGLKPKRTMRAVLWTAEEEGWWGALSYFNQHKGELDDFDLVMESDIGTFTPTGLAFTGNKTAQLMMGEVMKLLAPLNASYLREDADGPDITVFKNAGVPAASLLNENERYFWFHHSDGDTMSVQDPDEMDLCASVWAIVSYVVADLDQKLPRT